MKFIKRILFKSLCYGVHFKLLPKIICNTPATDNYEATNLISEHFLTKSRGFLSYSTVKPPIELTFELICPVNVHYIVLWTTVGNQRCTAIEILGKNHNREFASIAYARYNSIGIVFCNCRIYSSSNPPPNIDPSFHLSFFKGNSFRSFTSANVIKVCILQTERSVPCLGKIEIWGKPSKMCSSVTINTINRLIHGSERDKTKETATAPKNSANPSIEDWEIPDEFKDSLTYEVMAIPLTLPSGNSIDQSTLEKFVAAEASYGRPGSDPFTAQQFTESRKPVFNAALKSRIDMFLMKHAHRMETYSIKRTVGKIRSLEVGHGKKINKRISDDVPETNKKIKVVENTVVVENVGDSDKTLDDAIQKILNSSNFISFTTDSVAVAESISSCLECDKTNDLFVIPCSHLYCRKCLVDLCVSLICAKCKKPFSKNEAQKFHV